MPRIELLGEIFRLGDSTLGGTGIATLFLFEERCSGAILYNLGSILKTNPRQNVCCTWRTTSQSRGWPRSAATYSWTWEDTLAGTPSRRRRLSAPLEKSLPWNRMRLIGCSWKET